MQNLGSAAAYLVTLQSGLRRGSTGCTNSIASSDRALELRHRSSRLTNWKVAVPFLIFFLENSSKQEAVSKKEKQCLSFKHVLNYSEPSLQRDPRCFHEAPLQNLHHHRQGRPHQQQSNFERQHWQLQLKKISVPFFPSHTILLITPPSHGLNITSNVRVLAGVK